MKLKECSGFQQIAAYKWLCIFSPMQSLFGHQLPCFPIFKLTPSKLQFCCSISIHEYWGCHMNEPPRPKWISGIHDWIWRHWLSLQETTVCLLRGKTKVGNRRKAGVQTHSEGKGLPQSAIYGPAFMDWEGKARIMRSELLVRTG